MKLTEADYVDFAGYKNRRVRFPYTEALRSSRLHYMREGRQTSQVGHPFPRDARGFLYYHPPTSVHNHLRTGHFDYGHLRFRKTPNTDPASFDAGSDLLLPNGVPWTYASELSRHVFRNTPRKDLSTVSRLPHSLIAQGLVTSADIARWNTQLARRATINLRAPDQRFLVDFTTTKIAVQIADIPNWTWNMSFLQSWTQRRQYRLWQTGVAICQFEPCTFDASGAVSSIGLKVDEIVEPFVPRHGLEVEARPPTEGTFYVRPLGIHFKGFPPEAIVRFTRKSKPARILRQFFNNDSLEVV